MFHALRTFRAAVLRSAPWRPGNARVLADQVIHRARNRHAGFRDADHLFAAARWLARAQDVTGDGGVSGRYLLRGGWTSSYPETTGYLIPTFIALSQELQADEYRERARRCVDFLASVRLPGGAFPGGEIGENRTQPSVFNTAQIVHGLVEWHRATGEQRAIDMAIDAGNWLVSRLDADGAWRTHVYLGTPVAYAAHASCWLAQLGATVREPRFSEAAVRNMEWVLSLQDPASGWFDRAGWDEREFDERYAETHTIAYTIWGVLYTALTCGHQAGLAAARRAAVSVARRLELSRRLPGKLDAQWKPRARYQCLTGNAQMALIWMRLDEHECNPMLVNAAFKAIDQVKAAQSMANPDPGIRGGVPGSDPIWGDYISYALPNWAAKFYIDALLAKKAALGRLHLRGAPDAGWEPPEAVPRIPSADGPGPAGAPVRVVMYTRPTSHKVQQMVDAWSGWGFRPAAVVMEDGPRPSLRARAIARVRADGVRRFLAAVVRARAGARPQAALMREHRDTGREAIPVELYCARHAIPVIRVSSFSDTTTVAAVGALRPDLAIQAGCGILREAILAIPRLGTLNAHMGMLPRYRGMNVTEWTRILGGPTGCSVHFIDAGIDTGAVICVCPVDTSAARSIAELRALVDRIQIDALGSVTRLVVETSARPRAYVQRSEEGHQFFTLHPEIAAVLEQDLRDQSS